MSSQPPPPSLGVTHQRPRPSTAWWVGGALLLVAGVLLGIGLVVNVFVTMFQTDATLPRTSLGQQFELDEDRDYLLWMDESQGRSDCTIVDTSDGSLVTIHGMGSSRFSRNDQSAEGWFNSGSGELSAACVGPASVDVGPKPGAPDWIGGIIGAIVLPILLVLAGIAVLVVTGIRFAASRRP